MKAKVSTTPFTLIGQRIKDARNARGLTQAELATAVNLSRVSITNIEAGRQNVGLDSVTAISEYLGLNPEDWFSKTAPAHRLNGLAATVQLQADPYRALLETATRDEETALAELAKIEPRCEALRDEIERIRKVKASILAMLGEETEAQAATQAPSSQFGKRRWIDDIVEILRETGRDMTAAEVTEKIRASGRRVSIYSHQTVYTCMRSNPEILSHRAGGFFSLINGEAK